MAAKKKWPESVPIFTPRMIHKGSMDGPFGTHCAIGWLIKEFPQSDTLHVHPRVWRAFEVASGVTDGDVAGWNDSPRTAKKTIADALNKAARTLGYTEIVEVDA